MITHLHPVGFNLRKFSIIILHGDLVRSCNELPQLPSISLLSKEKKREEDEYQIISNLVKCKKRNFKCRSFIFSLRLNSKEH